MSDESSARVPGVTDLLAPVDDGVLIGLRLHIADRSHPNIFFFHGNGEIAANYDDLGPLYNRVGINFLAADYRGYGCSTGTPTTTAMMRDCHAVLSHVTGWLDRHGFKGPLIVMGRSLGSASAIELAHAHPNSVSGLIIESGFAYVAPLLRRLGVDPAAIGFREEEETTFRHIEKIGRWQKPLLVIHGEFDNIIPFSDGQALFDACPSAGKQLLRIKGADHNNLFLHGFGEYLAAVARLASACSNLPGAD
ncbi:MAG: alpha/beta fold hydrolase [Desulfobacterales bacterium]